MHEIQKGTHVFFLNLLVSKCLGLGDSRAVEVKMKRPVVFEALGQGLGLAVAKRK